MTQDRDLSRQPLGKVTKWGLEAVGPLEGGGTQISHPESIFLPVSSCPSGTMWIALATTC